MKQFHHTRFLCPQFRVMISSILILMAFQPISANVKITGKVLSENDSTAIIGATCKLFADGVQIISSSTDKQGVFSIEIKEYPELLLRDVL